MGTILIEGNIIATSWTNVDIRYKYVSMYVEDEIVNMLYMKSNEDDSGILMKNQGEGLHVKHESNKRDEKSNWLCRFRNI